MENDLYDVVVIGGGPGGYAASIRAAELGLRVALVEKAYLGGECLNRGCIPTKAMLAAAGLYHRMCHGASALGVVADDIRFEYGQVIRHRDTVVARLRSGFGLMIAAHKVVLLRGAATFMSPTTLDVAEDSDAHRIISFRHAVVAPGSAAALPSFLPASPRIVDSAGFLALPQLPKSLLVLGGGALGCEFATLAAQFNVSVTLVEQRDTILPDLDDDARALILESFKALGVCVRTDATLSNVEADDDGVYGQIGDEEVYGDLLLVATGRRPLTDGLNLSAAGVFADPDGISVDVQCRTSVPHIFAVGDVTRGSPMLANFATWQGRVAAENIAGHSAECVGAVPSCVFTLPEVAVAGLTETQAARTGVAVRTVRSHFSWNGRALAEGESCGFVKNLYAVDDGRLLGVEIAGPHASEFIAAAAAEICGTCPPPHPTLCESMPRA